MVFPIKIEYDLVDTCWKNNFDDLESTNDKIVGREGYVV
jgi:hypothetical protein